MAQKSTNEVPQEVVDAARAAAEREDRGTVAAPDANNPMTTSEAIAARNYVEYGSEAHENLLSSAYGGLTRADAEQIIKEREKDPHLWPWDRYQQAKKFLKALDGKPKPVSKKPHWTRDQV